MLDHLRYERIDGDREAAGGPRARQTEEASDDALHAFGLRPDDASVAPDWVGRVMRFFDHAGPPSHDLQWRSELVRHAGSERSDGGQPLAVP